MLKAYSMFKVSIKFYCYVAIKNNKKQDSNEYSIRTLWTCSVNSEHCSLYSKLLYWYNWVKMKIDHVDVWHHSNSVGDQHYPRNITIPINTELILSSFMRFQQWTSQYEAVKCKCAGSASQPKAKGGERRIWGWECQSPSGLFAKRSAPVNMLQNCPSIICQILKEFIVFGSICFDEAHVFF